MRDDENDNDLSARYGSEAESKENNLENKNS